MTIEKRTERTAQFLIFVLIFSFYLPFPNINLGFSLKIYMLASIICFFYLLSKHKLKLHIETFDISILLFFIWGGVTLFWARDMASTAKLFIGSLFVFFCYQSAKSYIISSCSNNERLEALFYRASATFVIISLILYIIGIQKIGGNYIAYEQVRVFGVLVEKGIPRLVGPLLDPNMFSFYICTAFFYTLLKKQKNLHDYIIFSSLCTALILTLSRGGIIAILFSLFIIVFLKTLRGLIKLRIKKPNLPFIIFFFTLLALALYTALSSAELTSILDNRISTIESGSGRFEIWNHAILLWKEHMFIGVGWFNFIEFNMAFFGGSNYVHNTFLETLVETGLIGFILYITFHAILLGRIIKLVQINKRFGFIFYSYLSTLVMFNSLSLIVNEMFFMLLIMVSIFYKNERLNEKNQFASFYKYKL